MLEVFPWSGSSEMALEYWLTFVVVWTIAGLPLGPNAVHTMTVAITYRFPRALLAPVGMALACVIHSFAASFGIGALLLLQPDLFLVLKLLGAGYLAWLGIRMWRSQPASAEAEPHQPMSALELVRRACLVSLANPKAVLSYVAVFTPFLLPDRDLLPQIAILVPTATVLVFLNYVGYALLAWPLRLWMTSAKRQLIFNRVSGSMFIGFATLLAISSRRGIA